MKTDPIKFETLDQILNDPKCRQYIREKIDSIRKQREKLLETARPGIELKLKRGPFDSLDESGLLFLDCLIAEFKLIKEKASNLAARERELITLIVSQAIIGTIRHYEAQEKAQKVKAEAKKKKLAKQSEK